MMAVFSKSLHFSSTTIGGKLEAHINGLVTLFALSLIQRRDAGSWACIDAIEVD